MTSFYRPSLKFLGFCCLFLFSEGCYASQPQAHQAGQAFASSLAGTVTGAARATSPHTVPGFQSHRPPEAGFDAHSLGERAAAAARTSPAGQQVREQAQGRQDL